MNYEVGKCYAFQFKEKYIGKDGNVYLHLQDPNNPNVFISVKPYSFQTDWEDIASTLECFCSGQDIHGNYRFELSKGYILKYLYGPFFGKYNDFTIEKRIDTGKDNVNCCQIRDSFGVSQWFFTKDMKFWEKYAVGDDIILDVKDIHPSQEGKNNAYLVLEQHKDKSNKTQEEAEDPSESFIRDETQESLGVEDDHTEFKSSIAFPAEKKGEEDMAMQLAIIMKSIAGFMNKDGGTLYIGVNDSGEPYKDIKKEFQYLNDDETDKYKYEANADHYKLKLNNKICRDLGSYAASLASVKLKKANGVTYAAIEIKKAESVVWYHGTELYVRCDNATRRMTNDGITKFILSSVKPERFKDIVNKPVSPEEQETVNEAEPQTAGKIAMSPKVVNKEEKAWRYISFFKTGKWALRKTPHVNPNDLVTEVSVPQNPKSYVMMIAYESGRVNAVELKHLLYGSGKKQNTLIPCDAPKSNGLTLGNDPIVNVFCMKKGGLVLMESVTPDGKTRIKAHQMEVVVPHNLINAQGNKMQKEGKLLRMAPVEAGTPEMDAICAMGILVKDYERYSKNGVNKAKMQGKYQELIDSILS